MYTVFKNAFNLKYFFCFFLLFFVVGLPDLQAQESGEIYNEYQGTYRARVLKIINEYEEDFFDTTYIVQDIDVKILSGKYTDDILTIENDFQPFEPGSRIYITHNKTIEGIDYYTVVNIDRRMPIVLLLSIFVLVVIGFGKWQGLRSLVALALSFFVIAFVLLPGILHGWNPLLASFVVSAGILFAAIFVTHGFTKEAIVAYSGTMIAVLLASLFAMFAVEITSLSGFSTEEATYLNLNTGGSLNFTALLLGAFIIGFLGVLDDIAITQAAVVTELWHANPGLSKKEVYSRAMRVGREHVGALVNTLVLAYTGASLPLLLHLKTSSLGFETVLNLEVFATEIVRIIVGSIGLILTVPIVTFLAVTYLKGSHPSGSGCKGHTH